MSTIKAAGFDLGETLLYYQDTPLDWSSLYPAALAAVAGACRFRPSDNQVADAGQVLARYNTRLSPRTREVPADEIMSLVLQCWRLETREHLSGAIEAFFSFFRQRMHAYPDVIPALKVLQEHGVRTGILTDVPYGMPSVFVQRDLELTGLGDFLDVVLTSADVGVRKPAAAGFLQLANRLGAPPQEMIYIGNEPKDVIGARAAGIGAIFLDRAGNGGNHGQALTFSTLSSLGDLVGP